MMYHADCAVQCDDEGDHEEGERHDAQGFAPCEADGDDGGGELPCCCAVVGVRGEGEWGWEGEKYLKASETQYEMKLVTPHFRAWRGTGSRSLFVLVDVILQYFLVILSLVK